MAQNPYLGIIIKGKKDVIQVNVLSHPGVLLHLKELLSCIVLKIHFLSDLEFSILDFLQYIGK